MSTPEGNRVRRELKVWSIFWKFRMIRMDWISNIEQGIMNGKRRYDLEDRLIDFAIQIIRVAESLPKTKVGNHIDGQLIRSGTSPAPNYGEAQSAESRSDFIHKMKISLKELRETRIWLLMITKGELIAATSEQKSLIAEYGELISIFVANKNTATHSRGET